MYCVHWSEWGWWPEWPKNVRGHRWRIFFLKSKVMERCIWPRRNFAGRGVCPHLGHLSFQPQSPRCRSPLSCFLIVLSYNFSLKRPPGYQIVVSLCLHDFWFDNECRNSRTYIEPSLNKRLVYTQVTLSNVLQRYGNKRKVDSPHCLLCNPNLKDNRESPGRPEQEEKRPLGLSVNVCYCHRAWADLFSHSCTPCSAKRWLGAVGCAAWGCSLSRGLWRRSSPFSFTPSRKLLIVFRLCLPLPPVSHAQIFQRCPISTWTAGVRGTISRYLVTIPTPSSTYHFYEMDIIGLEQDWPERKERSREMVDYAEAIQRLEWKSELAQALKLSSIAPRRWKVST